MLTDSVNMEYMKNANDTKMITKKQDTSILYLFTPSDINFRSSNVFVANSDFGKIFVIKNLLT